MMDRSYHRRRALVSGLIAGLLFALWLSVSVSMVIVAAHFVLKFW